MAPINLSLIPAGRPSIKLNQAGVDSIEAREDRVPRGEKFQGQDPYYNRFNLRLAEDLRNRQAPTSFTPDAKYYPNVGGQTFPSAAQAYMAEVAAERPVVTSDPAAALKKGLIAGEGIADGQNQGNLISGLLGDLDWRGMADRLIRTFQRPEMLTPGVSPLTSFGLSGAALNQAELAGAAAEQERQDKFSLAQLKAQPKPPKPSAEITNLYKQMGTYQTGLNTFDKIKGILSQGIATGGAGAGLNALTNLASAFNINLSPSAKKSINLAVAEIRTQLIASRAFGREANKDEQKLIRTLIPEAGIFTTIKELEEAYGNAAAVMKKRANETNAIMTGVYGLRSYGSVVPNIRDTPLYTRNTK